MPGPPRPHILSCESCFTRSKISSGVWGLGGSGAQNESREFGVWIYPSVSPGVKGIPVRG
jgi:hypothetical protein